ncbi:hydrogenase maturation protease, partial [Bradyrhizobium sp. NBAIM08]|nr:hydrogenase maturation protease [Bradyrhizobium sp. NBAIM08]
LVLHPLPDAERRAALSPLVIGVGNPWRRDDGAGLEVVSALRARCGDDVRAVAHEGDCMRLLDLWDAGSAVVLVDAACSGAAAGSVLRLGDGADLLRAPLRSSTHAFGVPEALALAHALDRAPRSAAIYAIEGADFGLGAG